MQLNVLVAEQQWTMGGGVLIINKGTCWFTRWVQVQTKQQLMSVWWLTHTAEESSSFREVLRAPKSISVLNMS